MIILSKPLELNTEKNNIVTWQQRMIDGDCGIPDWAKPKTEKQINDIKEYKELISKRSREDFEGAWHSQEPLCNGCHYLYPFFRNKRHEGYKCSFYKEYLYHRKHKDNIEVLRIDGCENNDYSTGLIVISS
jgi:Zn/Cd-binding protein ZinT